MNIQPVPYTTCTDKIRQNANQLQHYANPMVHPVTGETISSYKKMMQDPATAEVWQTAFGKENEKHGSRGQQNRSEGNKRNVRDDT